MRASFERSELLRLLGPVTKVVESRNTIPVLANVLLAVTLSDDGITDGAVSITGTDLDIRITATGAAKVAEAGAVTVDAKRLEDIVRKLTAGADIAVETETGFLVVRSGRSRFKLATLPASDFPDISTGTFDATFSADLAALFKPVSYSISSEATRYYLCGIYLHPADGKLRAVATNRHTLAQHEAEGVGDFPGVIVPAKTVGLVPPGVVSVSVSATKVRFATAGLEVVSKVIDGTFPDYQRVIPRSNDKLARVDRALMAASADRVATIATDKSRCVKVSFMSGALQLSARSEQSEASDEIAAEYGSEPVDIGFNAGYVRDTLNALSGEQVEISLADSMTPALFRDGGNMLAIIMPMRV